MKNLYDVTSIFSRDYNTFDIDGSRLSKSKRIDSMVSIIQNNYYNYNFTKEERIFASKCITVILNEIDY